ncbi:hypothetical protein FOCC_FOCC005542 [Frankliniella occidentalis]|nr:hypothetical protein FOCC_FOCC005542 [Frankliniella occidentalis]
MFPCSLCRNAMFSGATEYLDHYKDKHQKEIGLGYMLCTQVDCVSRRFGKYNSFYRHVMAHKTDESSGNPIGPINMTSHAAKVLRTIDMPCPQLVDSNVPDDDIDMDDSAHNSTLHSVDFDEALTNAVVSFLGRLYDCGSFTESQIQLVIDSHQQLLGGGFLSVLKLEVVSLLNQSVAATDKVKNIIRKFDSCQNLFQGFETHYRRLSEFTQTGAYIAPEPYIIGRSTNEVNDDGFVVVEPIELVGQFIPFGRVIKGFLELPGVLKSILNYMSDLDSSYTESGPIENIIQGELWREKIKPKFEGKIVLPLKFNFDDYEPNKELGYHTGTHKLGAGYIQIATIPPKFASLLENIFLAVLFHSNDRAAGNDKVFRKVLFELKDLEEKGIKVVTNEGVFQLYFALCLVTGDNLGSNGILGFVESFSAHFFCRICSEQKCITDYQTESNPLKRRNCETYESDLAINDSSQTGRKGPCVFNTLGSFDVSENIYLDQMHDLDEGVSKYIMYQIVKYLYDMKRFDVDQLNDLIQGFYYGYGEEKNKMPYISKEDLTVNKKIRCSASEMRCFVRYFGLMVGHLVRDEDKAVWNLYLLHRKIIDIMTAPIIRNLDCIEIKSLIKKHHSEYIRIFQTHLQPKFHLLLHEDEVLRLSGPQEPLSCYRTEHKHKEGKDIARRSKNRINLPLTIATYHQTKLAFRLLSGRGFQPKFSYNVVKSERIDQHPNFSKFRHLIPSDFCDSWDTTKCLEVSGAKYGIGTVLLHSLNNDKPVFAQLDKIIIRPGNEAFFLLKKLTVVRFDSHFYAYQISHSNEWLFVNVNQLLSHISTEIRHRNNKMFVPFRFNVKCFQRN